MPGLFFNQKLDSISKSTRDKWGDTTTTIIYQSVPCRFTDDITKIREVATEDEKVVALVYTFPKYTIKVDYEITYENEDYLVSRVIKQRDLFGNVHHQKILLISR